MQTSQATSPAASATVIALPARAGTDAARWDRAGVRSSSHLEPTRRGRLVITVLAFLLGLVVAAVVLLALDVPSALAGGEETSDRTVVVAEGETLWDYAEEHAPEGMSETEYVAAVRSVNHLPTGRLTAGQELLLPALESVG